MKESERKNLKRDMENSIKRFEELVRELSDIQDAVEDVKDSLNQSLEELKESRESEKDDLPPLPKPEAESDSEEDNLPPLPKPEAESDSEEDDLPPLPKPEAESDSEEDDLPPLPTPDESDDEELFKAFERAANRNSKESPMEELESLLKEVSQANVARDSAMEKCLAQLERLSENQPELAAALKKSFKRVSDEENLEIPKPDLVKDFVTLLKDVTNYKGFLNTINQPKFESLTPFAKVNQKAFERRAEFQENQKAERTQQGSVNPKTTQHRMK